MFLVNLRTIILCIQTLSFVNIFIVTSSTQLKFDDEKEAIRSNCLNKTTCGECIMSADCLWCSQPDFDDVEKNPKPRCDIDIDGVSECEERYVFRHISDQYTTSARKIEKAYGKLPATSITPQGMKVKLSIGKPVEFSVSIGEMEDYPLDLYFLMDLTKTMEDDKKVLAEQGMALADKMQELTSKFRLGFGSFIDKVAMPFVQTNPKYLEKLKLKCPECVPPYGFKNHLVLSENVTRFSEEVEKAKISASSDLPEGGFDALMQVIVCDKEIGWAAQARKLVVFATDDGFHIAGDGKLGGIIRPNDGLCHLDSNGEYTHSAELDYPSIAQLNSKAGEKSITVIFAVTSNQVAIYKQLSNRLEGSRTTEMTANSSNIVDTVEEEYKKISQTVEIWDNFTSQYFSVQYFSKCLDESGSEDETILCTGVRIGDIVTFNVRLELLKCPESQNDWNQIFKIYRSNVPDALLIDLEMLCSCPCEKPGVGEPNSEKCKGKGTLKCGLCKCDSQYFGRHCECDYLHKNGTKIDESKACKHPDSEEVCSGRGSCICRECQCSLRSNPSEVYSGPFCECDNFSCDRINGELCSGHGSCICGKCVCNHGWSGTGCQCSNNIDTCRERLTDEICGGETRGECECGQCKCKGFYSGEFCEKCRHEECPNNCNDLKDCVQCRLFNSGVHENPADCELNCYKYKGLGKNDTVDVLKESDDEDSDEVMCREKDSADNCTFYFLYNHDRRADTYTILAQREKECPPELPIFWISFGIIILIIIIGLATLMIWKLYDYLQTKREYSKFKNERQNVHWATGQNILYKEPTTTFNNPMYGGMHEQMGFATGERDDTTQSSSRRRGLKHQESNVDDKLDN